MQFGWFYNCLEQRGFVSKKRTPETCVIQTNINNSHVLEQSTFLMPKYSAKS